MIDEQSQRVDTTIRLRPLSHRGWEEGEDVDMPLRIDDDRVLMQQEVDFNCDHDCPQGMEQVQRLKNVGLAIAYWTFCVGSVDG